MSSPHKRLRKHSHNEFLSLMISAKRLPPSAYQHITDLNLSNLQLIQIDAFPFEHLPQLLSLDLSYNQLITINADWSKSSSNAISKLNVSHNRLETLLFLRDFKALKSLTITENLFNNHERFLALHLCPSIEKLVDGHRDHSDDDQLKLDQWLQIMETKIDRLWSMSYYDKYEQESKIERNTTMVKRLHDDFRHAVIKIFEKQASFSQIHLSPLANYLIGKKIDELCASSVKVQSKQSLKTHLTKDFTELMETKQAFEPVKFLRCHQSSEQDLASVSVRMCAFEPNASTSVVATCGGQKICFIDCETCEVTHLYEVSALRSTAIPTGRKMKEKTRVATAEHFSCLCWIEVPDAAEKVNVLAVGATNGHIYLLSPKWKVMFGHIELPNSSVSCLTWHSSNRSTLAVGSFSTVRLLNIQPYLDRLLSFVRQQNKPLASFAPRLSITETYHLDNGDDSVLHITDLLTCPGAVLLVGTTSGLFVIREQTPMKIAFPKSMWTAGEHIESLGLIEHSTRLIAMNVLGLDQIYCFDLDQSLVDQQLHVTIALPNPYRQIASRLAVHSTNNENDDRSSASFECVLGSDHGSFFHHRIRLLQAASTKRSKKATFDNQRTEIGWPQVKTATVPSLLSSCLNEQYLCLTTSTNLVCIYKRM